MAAQTSEDPQEVCQRLSNQVQQKTVGEFYKALQFPDSSKARNLPGTFHTLISSLQTIPDPSEIQPVVAADKYRLIAFLEVAEARLEGALAESGRVPSGEDFKQARCSLARGALKDLERAQKWLQVATDPKDPDFAPTIPALITENQLREHITMLTVTAHSILWVLEDKKEDKQAAANLWHTLPPLYIQDNFPPAPEVVKTLDLATPLSLNSGMTPVAWVGIGLLVLGLVTAIFFPKTSLFQQWAIRVVIAIGAAMAATVIPGLLNIKVSEWIVAGGTLAVIVLIYLFNPPKIE